MFSPADYQFMSRAIRLAKNGSYTTDPNPNVGCVLVKDNAILAEGWHVRAGSAHAEIEALKQVQDATAMTAYVTLEPCSHHGKTPPCCDALIRSGVSRVVVAMQDPNPLVAGQGLQRMREAGIIVQCGLLQEDAIALNPGFIKRMQTGLPRVISKMGMSLDGRTAMASGASQWITSPQARQDVHLLRASSSAILTGINTVLHDDCSLTARLEKDVALIQPVRVVLDSALQFPLHARMLGLAGRTLILTCSDDAFKKQQLEQLGTEVFVLPANQQQRVDLHAVMRLLAKLNMNQLLIEAGATLNGALMQQQLVDEWIIYMAPSILGDCGRGLFKLTGMQTMADKINLKITQIRQVGPDLKLTCVVNR